MASSRLIGMPAIATRILEIMHILLVEDDIDMSKALLRALERRGFQVTHCADGISALSHIKDAIGDLVVLDLNIPGLDGLHLLQRIRSQNIHTPVIVLTARGAVGDRVVGLNAGATIIWPSHSIWMSSTPAFGPCCGARGMPRKASRNAAICVSNTAPAPSIVVTTLWNSHRANTIC